MEPFGQGSALARPLTRASKPVANTAPTKCALTRITSIGSIRPPAITPAAATGSVGSRPTPRHRSFPVPAGIRPRAVGWPPSRCSGAQVLTPRCIMPSPPITASTSTPSATASRDICRASAKSRLSRISTSSPASRKRPATWGSSSWARPLPDDGLTTRVTLRLTYERPARHARTARAGQDPPRCCAGTDPGPAKASCRASRRSWI